MGVPSQARLMHSSRASVDSRTRSSSDLPSISCRVRVRRSTVLYWLSRARGGGAILSGELSLVLPFLIRRPSSPWRTKTSPCRQRARRAARRFTYGGGVERRIAACVWPFPSSWSSRSAGSSVLHDRSFGLLIINVHLLTYFHIVGDEGTACCSSPPGGCGKVCQFLLELLPTRDEAILIQM